jgi:hypothetical protein
VGFSSIIVTQLAQTFQMGRVQDTLSSSVTGAIAGSLGMLGLAVGVPPIRTFLGLAAPTPVALLLTAATAPAAMAMGGLLGD